MALIKDAKKGREHENTSANIDYLAPHQTSGDKKRIVVAGTLVLLFLIISPILTYMNFARDIADRQRLMNRERTGIVIKDRNGEILYNYGKVNGYPELGLHEISDNLEQAVIASEDRGFYDHEGYSLRGITRALYANIITQDPTRYGGSTITQQLVKNKLLGASKNYFRKYQEVTMAIAVEQRYSKQEIMEMYLNSVYFGEGAFGVAAAADTYFGKPAQDLTLEESAMLAGLLPAPSAYSPISGDKEEAEDQQAWILSRMVDAGYINNSQKEKAKDKKLTYAPQDKAQYPHAQHYVMMVLNELKEKYGEENITRLGFEVNTTLDLDWQKQAEKRIQEKIGQIKNVGATNASLVGIDPKSGEIRMLVGSVDWNNPRFGKVNMATTPRQPGSSFKPIYYTEALNRRLITPATVLEDKPKTFGNYRPQNFDFRFRGDIPVRFALAQSLNIPSIEVMQKLGVDEASRIAQKMGIRDVDEPEKYGLTLALGTAEVKVLDMTNAYAALANQGLQYDASMISSIEDKFDNKVFEATKDPQRVTTPEASFLISSILSDNQARSPTFGSSLNIDGEQVAVKTGTTDDSRDAWTIGYTPDLSVGVWVGNNQHEPMTGLIGSSSAGAIWRDTMSNLVEAGGDRTFKPTPSIVQQEVCLGFSFPFRFGRDGTYMEYFIKGTAPKDSCQKPESEDDDKPKRREEDEKPENEDEDEGREERDDEDRGGRGGGTEEPQLPPEPPAEEPPAEEPPATEPPPEGESSE